MLRGAFSLLIFDPTCSGDHGCLGRLLPFLLFVADPPGLGLRIPDLTEVQPHGPRAERVGLGLPAVLLECCAEAADEGVKAAPRLAERAWAGGRRVRVAEEGAELGVDLGLAELVEVPEELEDVGAAAPGERERRPVVAEVLPEGVPVPALLVLISAGRRSHRAGGGSGYCRGGSGRRGGG